MNGKRRVRKLCFLFVILTLLHNGISVSTPTYLEEEITTVEGVEGETVKLPCDLFPMNNEDKINLILWYKDDGKDPIYSYDARLAVFSSERHHLKESFLKGRVTFTPSPGSPIPHRLSLSRLQQVDAGRYSCRVDFTMAQSSNRMVYLKIITPVSSVQIHDSQGRQTPSVLEPIPEGGTLNITCTARGGRPQPNVSWWMNEAMVDDSWTEVAKGVVSNNLVISPLTRAHVHAVLKCKAAPSLVAVSTATVTIDMYLKPESVEITAGGTSGTIRAGEYLDLTCKTRGSRPAPIINWYKGAEVIPTKKSSLKALMGVSAVSQARIQIHKEDDGARVTCRVNNPSLPHHTLQERITLNVTYPPEVELRMGSKLEGTVIKESSDLYLTCHVEANPNPQMIRFMHQGRIVKHDTKRNIVISGRNLVLRSIQRTQSGVYTCSAINALGKGTSSPMNITVLYAPVCKHSPDVWAKPGNEVRATCSVSSSPADNLQFSWVWVTPTYTRRILPVRSDGLTSNVSFVIPHDNGSLTELGPSNKLGTLQCWARNTVGRQVDPCTVDVRRPIACSERMLEGNSATPCMIPKIQKKPPIIPAPPSAPINCTLTGIGREKVRVTCQPGDTRTIPQTYQLQIYEAKTKKLHINVTSPIPSFLVPNLTAGRDYTVYVSSHTSYGGSPYKLVEAFNFKTAENRMRENEGEAISWMMVLIFVSCVGGVILFILFVTTLIRFRLRRSQHKCTVRRTPSTGEPKLADKNLYLDTPPEVPPSSVEKKFGLEEAASSSVHQPGGTVADLSPEKSPRESTNPPSIIRQPSTRLQPIIKENGRAEPVRSTQPRTVLFVEPPKSRPDVFLHKDDHLRPDYCNTLYPGRGNACVSSRNGEGRSNYYPSPRNALPLEPVPPVSYPEREAKSLRATVHSDLQDPDAYDTPFSPESSNTLTRESEYVFPRQPSSEGYRGSLPPVRTAHDTTSIGTVTKRDFRESREPTKHQFVFPSHSGREMTFEHPTHSHPPPLVRSSSSPPPPRPSIMKKSPSVGGSIYTRRHEHSLPPSRGDGPTYRSLPRPNKNRHCDIDSDLNRYRSLDRRFDIPFTGSLPRPQTRRGSRAERRMLERSDSRCDFRSSDNGRSSDTRLDRADIRLDSRPDVRYDSRSSVRSLRESGMPARRPSAGSRLRFSNEKYFHVYPDKEKRQTRDDDTDENFV